MNRSVRSVTVTTAALALAVVLWPPSAHAQSRSQSRPRPPATPATGRAVPRGTVQHPIYGRGGYYAPYYSRYYYPYYSRYYYPYYPYYYSPYYYGNFFFGLSWGYPYYYGYGPYPYQPYYGYYDDSSSLRLQVKPNQAEVYLDGHYVGLVDSYDGMFQRLYVPPGDHSVEIFHEGYRSVKESMRFVPREGYDLKRVMEPLAPGDPAPVRPKPDPSARRDERDSRDSYGRRPAPRDRDRVEAQESRDAAPSSDSGAVAIRVQPGGATILIDGEKWDGPEGTERLVVQLSEGAHKIEIQKEGYRPFVTEVRIRRSETVPLNVSLRTGG